MENEEVDLVPVATELLTGAAFVGVETPNAVLCVILASGKLTVWCAWRLIQGNEIVVTSRTPEFAAAVTAILQNGTLESVQLAKPFHDLSLRFADGHTLQTFADSDLYEHWNFVAPPERVLIAGPGGVCAVW